MLEGYDYREIAGTMFDDPETDYDEDTNVLLGIGYRRGDNRCYPKRSVRVATGDNFHR